MRASIIAVAALGATLAADPLAAHGVWVVKRLDRLVLVLGHSDQEDSYPPEKLVRIDAADASGRSRPLSERAAGEPYWSIPRDQGIAMLAVSYRGGYSGQTASGAWRDVAKGEDPEVLAVGRYDKYSLTILDPAADVAQAPVTRMQITPLVNPLALKRGALLPVRVTFDGKPLAGVRLSPDYAGDADQSPIATDAEGKANVPIQHQGLNVIGAVWIERPGADSQADFIEHIATLNFGLRPLSHQSGYMHPEMLRALQQEREGGVR